MSERAKTHRVLGLDVGSRTIGIAVTDELGVAAHAVKTLGRKGTNADVAQIASIARSYGTTRLVVGVPYDEAGEVGPRAKRVLVLADALRAGGFEVELQDERNTTIEAEATLLEADLSRARRKQVIDSLAAQVILTAWLSRGSG